MMSTSIGSVGTTSTGRAATQPYVELALMSLCVVSIFQLYIIGISGIYIPLFLAMSLAAAPILFFLIKTSKLSVIAPMIVLILFQLLSIIWAPDKLLGVRQISYSIPMLFAALIFFTFRYKYNMSFRKICAIYAIISLIHSILCIIFRIMPNLESFFLSSGFSDLIINPNTRADLFTVLRNNVLDPKKSAGFLVNGNIAAAWCALNACVAISLAGPARRRLFWIVIAALHIAGAVATGSKAAVFLLIVASIAGWLTWTMAGRRLSSARVLLLIVSVLLIIIGGAVANGLILNSELAERSGQALAQRQLIWGRAGEAFIQSPWLGQGYGGWARDFQAFGAAAREAGLGIGEFPAHNTFIILWSENGVFAVVLGIWLVVAGYRDSLRGASHGERLASAAAVAGWTWFVLHGLGENFGLFGDPHMQVPLALLLAGSAGAVSPRRQRPPATIVQVQLPRSGALQ